VEPSIYTHDFDFDAWQKLHKDAITVLKKTGSLLSPDEFFDKVPQKDRRAFFNHVNISREVRKNLFGKWGLDEWDEVSPRGVREKIYLVLKETKKPLHFRDITSLIDEYGLAKKGRTAHPQTVHNELIKDPRFVLVGRGVYALSEWGYKPGTVRDVVEDILTKSKKPLTAEEILSGVLAVRHVKKSTVMINLHNFFLKDGSRYRLRQ